MYYYGDGIHAPIMGVSYYVNFGDWRLGPTPFRNTEGCPIMQDDDAILSKELQ